MNYEIVDQKAHLVRERVLGDCENCPARLQAMLLIRDLKFEKIDAIDTFQPGPFPS
jgi:hypothetical protein